VGDLLTDLDTYKENSVSRKTPIQYDEGKLTSSPRVMGEGFGTVRTLLCRHHIFNLKSLLENRALECLLLNRDLELYTPGVWFGPNKTGVDNSDSGQASEFSKTQRK
jgi:hypothetical protein